MNDGQYLERGGEKGENDEEGVEGGAGAPEMSRDPRDTASEGPIRATNSEHTSYSETDRVLHSRTTTLNRPVVHRPTVTVSPCLSSSSFLRHQRWSAPPSPCAPHSTATSSSRPHIELTIRLNSFKTRLTPTDQTNKHVEESDAEECGRAAVQEECAIWVKEDCRSMSILAFRLGPDPPPCGLRRSLARHCLPSWSPCRACLRV